jgi:EpsG family
MLTYWLLFLVPAWASIAAPSKPKLAGNTASGWDPAWLLAGVALALLIGFRYKVGGDWATYERHYVDMIGASLPEVLEKPDPGYFFINWLSSQFDGGIYTVNLICGALFSWGLVAFCRAQPRPWLAIAVAMPYMVTVVAMGYSRQGVALGLTMLGLAGLARGNVRYFIVSVALAATFHKSAVVLIPLAVLATPRSRVWTGIWVGISAFVLYYFLLASSVEVLVTGYIDAQYESEGAAIRIAMNVLPAVLLLSLRRRFAWPPAERNLWVMVSVLALASVLWLLVSASSTAVDRLALYLIPLQLYVFSRLPDLLSGATKRRFWVLAAVAYYSLVLFVWLNFATNALYWLPFRFYFFE